MFLKHIFGIYNTIVQYCSVLLRISCHIHQPGSTIFDVLCCFVPFTLRFPGDIPTTRRIQESAQTAASVLSCLHSVDAIWWPTAGNVKKLKKEETSLFHPERACDFKLSKEEIFLGCFCR